MKPRLEHGQTDIPLSHTPGSGHRRKSDPPKKKRWEDKAKKKRDDADKRYREAIEEWGRMSEPARRLQPEYDPDKFRPRWIPIVMTKPKSGTPITKRSFGSGWLELVYLCEKTRYWLYLMKDKAYARRYLGRLEQVIHDLPKNDQAITRWEGLALLHELKGEIQSAIAFREREIAQIRKLHKEADKHMESTRAYMLRGRDKDALKERQAILNVLKQELKATAGTPD